MIKKCMVLLIALFISSCTTSNNPVDLTNNSAGNGTGNDNGTVTIPQSLETVKTPTITPASGELWFFRV